MLLQRLHATTPVVAVSVALTAAASLIIFRLGTTAGLVFALVPLGLVVAALLVGSGRILLYAAAFALPLSGVGVFLRPLPFGGANVHPQDLIIVVVLGGWAFA